MIADQRAPTHNYKRTLGHGAERILGDDAGIAGKCHNAIIGVPSLDGYGSGGMHDWHKAVANRLRRPNCRHLSSRWERGDVLHRSNTTGQSYQDKECD
jgi:hypothetical protein